ncbi:hypothetical protein ACFPZL_01405 [Leucobacter soli]|uniref:Uncharacterized protein n=1 Tax=Leucobacter soli TaxID=2812850 RepID=A0A916NP84_9MICO|nr:hypothetical protein [Leucobacter soli]CAG7612592.1 hypothetical protein LEUCIP111803_01586 [Leucobacter soli]
MTASPAGQLRSRRAWGILLALLGIETVAGVIALIPLGVAFFAADGEEAGQRVSVLLGGLLAIVWIAVTFTGALRARASWARGSALTLHVLMFAAGTGILQYGLADSWIGWSLVIAAFVGFFSALAARPEYTAAADEDGTTTEV